MRFPAISKREKQYFIALETFIEKEGLTDLYKNTETVYLQII